jgi:hypothetical protein
MLTLTDTPTDLFHYPHLLLEKWIPAPPVSEQSIRLVTASSIGLWAHGTVSHSTGEILGVIDGGQVR